MLFSVTLVLIDSITYVMLAGNPASGRLPIHGPNVVTEEYHPLISISIALKESKGDIDN